MSSYFADVFLAVDSAVVRGDLIHRHGRDKEFHFQEWFKKRLEEQKIAFDDNGRNSYPDFPLVHHPAGFELKALAYPGREFDFDCNSQVPSGKHNEREIFYVFGRYPAAPESDEQFPVLDLVMCHGDFLNADSSYEHKNRSAKGFGSYGDIYIRDRKMYVAKTPFGIAKGLDRQVTLISRAALDEERLKKVARLVRTEAAKLLKAYSFDLTTNSLEPTYVDNPTAGRQHEFYVYRSAGSTTKSTSDIEVSLR